MQDDAQLVADLLDLDVGLAEDREQVPGAGLLQLLAHDEVGVHAHEQDRDSAEPALGRDLREVVGRGRVLGLRAQNLRVEREREHAQQVEVACP